MNYIHSSVASPQPLIYLISKKRDALRGMPHVWVRLIWRYVNCRYIEELTISLMGKPCKDTHNIHNVKIIATEIGLQLAFELHTTIITTSTLFYVRFSVSTSFIRSHLYVHLTTLSLPTVFDLIAIQ